MSTNAAMIEPVKMGENKYAADGAKDIYAYALNGASGLTLGQAIASVMVRYAAAQELRSVTLMNRLSLSSDFLDAVVNVSDQLTMNDSVLWSTPADLPDSYEIRSEKFRASGRTIRDFLVYECEIDETSLPDHLSDTGVAENPGYDNRMRAFELLKKVMEENTRTNQELTINLQTVIQRRDTALNTSSNLVKALGSSKSNEAEAF